MGRQKSGISMKSLQRMLEIKTYKTVWTMGHKIRQALADRDADYKLAGLIEMDDTYFGAPKPGKRGRGAAGTGAEPRYKYGVVHLYAETGVACLPVALNSGLFWPRRSWRRYPGTIRVEVLDPIAPGLDDDEFFQHLQQTIEIATAQLIAEGERELAKNGIRQATLAPSS